MRIVGYQAFYDSEEINLSPGINLIVGQNNSGKSSILKALSVEFYDVRHKEPNLTVANILKKPVVFLELHMSGHELREVMAEDTRSIVISSSGGDIVFDANKILDSPKLSIKLKRYPGGSDSFLVEEGPFSEEGLIAHHPSNHYLVRLQDGELKPTGSTTPESAGDLYGSMWLSRSFYFSAQRYSFPRGKVSYQHKLDPVCRNLPSVLHTLMTTRTDLFDKLVSHMREIFQTVGNLSVGPVPGEDGEVEVRVWPTSSREDHELSFPLDACGTGIGQTLSLLAAIMTTKDSVILIDEINSYLHSSAVKSLIRIIKKEYNNHQYIISTHAPEVISAFAPDSLYIVKKDAYRAIVMPLSAQDATSFDEISSELGVSVADVFGADSVIWVEGETEEICFPKLYEFKHKSRLPYGVKFIAVCSTSDLIRKGRKIELAFNIYKRLANAGANILTSSKFSFDTEQLSEQQIRDAKKLDGGIISFIPARCIECYVFFAEAISSLLYIKSGGTLQISIEDLKLNMLKQANLIGYEFKSYDEMVVREHRSSLDAAKIISKTVSSATDERYQFNKKTDTLIMFEYLMSVEHAQINEICEYVSSLVGAGKPTGADGQA